MQENVGDVDQRVRVALGTALLAAAAGPLAARRGQISGLSAMVVGALAMESAITRTCPVNAWLGIDTRGR